MKEERTNISGYDVVMDVVTEGVVVVVADGLGSDVVRALNDGPCSRATHNTQILNSMVRMT